MRKGIAGRNDPAFRLRLRPDLKKWLDENVKEGSINNYLNRLVEQRKLEFEQRETFPTTPANR